MPQFYFCQGERMVQVAKHPFTTELCEGVVASEFDMFGKRFIYLGDPDSHGITIYDHSTPAQIDTKTSKGIKISGTVIYKAE